MKDFRKRKGRKFLLSEEKKKKKKSRMNFYPIEFYLHDMWVISSDFKNRNNQSADLTCLEEADCVQLFKRWFFFAFGKKRKLTIGRPLRFSLHLILNKT